MKLVLDEMMPKRFAGYLRDHEVAHVAVLGWRHVTNGKLLTLCQSAGYSVFITKDGNLPHQQNLTGRSIAVVVLEPETQSFEDLIILAPRVLQLLPGLTPGSVTRVGPS